MNEINYWFVLALLVFVSLDLVGVLVALLRIVEGSPTKEKMRLRRVELDRMHCGCGRRLLVVRYCPVCEREER